MTKSRANFKYPTEAFGRIPSFNDIEEEAEFWDTHDLSEFVGIEFHPVEARDSTEPPNTTSTRAFHHQRRSRCP